MSRVVVITGATSGIGRATALGLAREEACLVLIGRNRHRGADVVRRLAQRAPGIRSRFLEADLSRQGEVRRVAKLINKDFDRVDLLINNAGARFDRFGVTEDGIEQTFATNHLGHFLLTRLLLPALRSAPSSRIITVTSRAHFVAKADGCWLYREQNYDRRQAYAKSKLANVLFAFELARRLDGTKIVSVAVDPGVVASRFALNNGPIAWVKHVFSHWAKGTLVSPKTAARSIVRLATAAEPTSLTGSLFYNDQAIEASESARSLAMAQDLWDQSARLAGDDIDLLPFSETRRSGRTSNRPQPALNSAFVLNHLQTRDDSQSATQNGGI